MSRADLAWDVAIVASYVADNPVVRELETTEERLEECVMGLDTALREYAWETQSKAVQVEYQAWMAKFRGET